MIYLNKIKITYPKVEFVEGLVIIIINKIKKIRKGDVEEGG